MVLRRWVKVKGFGLRDSYNLPKLNSAVDNLIDPLHRPFFITMMLGFVDEQPSMKHHAQV